MLIIADKRSSVILVILHHYMLRNKQSHSHSSYEVDGCVICISNKVECLDKGRSYKNSTREVILLF